MIKAQADSNPDGFQIERFVSGSLMVMPAVFVPDFRFSRKSFDFKQADKIKSKSRTKDFDFQAA